jgi:hypothetical protein
MDRSLLKRGRSGIEKPEMLKRHIVFQDENKGTYIEIMLGGGPG